MKTHSILIDSVLRIACVALLIMTRIASAADVSVYSPPSIDDQARDFVDDLKFTSLDAISIAGLEASRLAQQPWSDSYWPYYQGLLAIRYADPNFPASENWKVNARYILKTLGEKPTWMLSPAEKYDLLVGDTEFTLTRTMISLGKALYHGPGTPAEWMGLCHGWAAASISVPRPRHSVLAIGNGSSNLIYFSPSDIKGLLSLLWARDRYPKRFVGRRCNLLDPPVDSSSRPVSRRCLDTNPATWHLSIVNQLGYAKKSFIIDADSTAEVWNHPVLGYKTRYFNPLTGSPTERWVEGTVRRSDFRNDRFRRNRSEKTKYITGVEMEVTYMIEDFPRSNPIDGEEWDKLTTVTYRYDLELDAAGVIIGGEWHSPVHPDFIWSPLLNANHSLSSQEDWSGRTPIPDNWKQIARHSSSRGKPLSAIVNRLLDLANE
ncbi:MAG: hypothetical protein KGQ59_09040 [Bdellovibrionales bacterium]|nr:hypothetical protein [Bdellovibrionales bacterium]